MIRTSAVNQVVVLTGLLVLMASAGIGRAADFFTIQGTSPTLYLYDDVGTQQSWNITGTDTAFTIGDNFNTNIKVYIYPDAKDYGITSAVNGVGFGVYPQRNLHIHDATDSPTVRFEDAVGGTPQLWDLEGGQAGFKLIDDPNGANVTTLRVNPGAPQDSFVVTGDGDIGMGLNNPQARLHIFPQNNYHANLRLETPAGAGGIPNQAWDLAGNAGGFSLTDVTAGMTQPFSVAPAAPTYTLFLAANGSVGCGTNAPNAIGAAIGTGRFFNVRASGATAPTGVANGVFQGQLGAQNHFAHLGAAANQRIMRLQTSSGFTGFHVLNDTLTSYAVANVISMKMANGNVGLKVQNPSHPLHLASGAHCTVGGVWTNASSRDLKQDIQPITSEQARETVRALQPVEYRYKEQQDEQYVGFIAEDVPELVATNDRKSLASMDITAVLTKVVQDQDTLLQNQHRQLADERRRNDEQQQLIAQQQQMLAALTRRLTDLEQRTVRLGDTTP